MTSAIHQAVVDDILAQFPGARTKGFLAALRPLFSGRQTEPLPPGLRILPDAYVIDRPRRMVVVYEVEFRTRLDDSRRENYARLAWCLNDIRWKLGLIVFDCASQTQKTVDVLLEDIRATCSKLPPAVPRGIQRFKSTPDHTRRRIAGLPRATP